MAKKKTGKIVWHDLTVNDAIQISDFYQQVTGWTVPPEPLTAPETGTYTVKLYDSYGDGWSGGKLDVLVNGVVVLDDITLASGAGPAAYTFSANAGDIISTIFTAGSWANENWYEILDPNNVVIATDGVGTNPPTGIDVPQPPQPLIAPATGTYTVNLYDDYGDGWDTSLLSVYVNGAIVLENITLATGAGPEAYTFTANTGDEVCTVFKAGAWPGEIRTPLDSGDLRRPCRRARHAVRRFVCAQLGATG